MSKVNYFKPEDFEGFGLLIGDRDGIAAIANAKLESAPVVYGRDIGDKWYGASWDGCQETETHTARLVCIEPLVQESAEDLLREIINNLDASARGPDEWDKWNDILKRSRALLAKEEK